VVKGAPQHLLGALQIAWLTSSRLSISAPITLQSVAGCSNRQNSAPAR